MTVITARRYVSAVYAVAICSFVRPSVRPSVLPSKAGIIPVVKRRITKKTSNDSAWTLVFWCHISQRNSNGVTSNENVKYRWGKSNLAIFDHYISATVQDRDKVTMKC